MRSIRELTFVLYSGTTLEDGSVMAADRCVIEQEDDVLHITLVDPYGEQFYQDKFRPSLQPAIISLCHTCRVRTTVMDLSK